MTKELILDRIRGTIRELFMDDSIEVTRDTVSADVEGWDSFEHINLLVSVEYEFNIRFDMAAVSAAANVGDLVDLVYAELTK